MCIFYIMNFKKAKDSLEKIWKKPNSRYVYLKTGEFVLLELEMSDCYFATPEFQKYQNWLYREEATLLDEWEHPPRPVPKDCATYTGELVTDQMLDPMNIDAYKKGTWQREF